jgi:hypothetical protein
VDELVCSMRGAHGALHQLVKRLHLEIQKLGRGRWQAPLHPGRERYPCLIFNQRFLSSDFRINSRIASERLTEWLAAQLSMRRVRSGGNRAATTGSLPVAGRPSLGLTFIDFLGIFGLYPKSEPRGSSHFPPGSNPQHLILSASSRASESSLSGVPASGVIALP